MASKPNGCFDFKRPCNSIKCSFCFPGLKLMRQKAVKMGNWKKVHK